MPMPTPREDEEKDEFIDRCMGDETMNDEFEDPAQRRAVCESQWDEGQEESSVAARSGIVEAIRQVPWAILPATLEMLLGAARGGNWEAVKAQVRTPPARLDGMIAILPLTGIISQRTDLFQFVFGGTSTDAWGRAFDRFVGDPQVRAIFIDVDSPGGTVYGVSELAAKIHAARGTKPIVAIANSTMASAAYWIASAADEVIVTPGGEVGSIGVLAVHVDTSKFLDAMGLRVSLVSAGKHKVEGNEYEPLSDEARVIWQKRIDGYYAMFVKDVAKHRGVSPGEVRSGYGEGRMVSASDVVAQGMADREATFEEALGRLTRRFGRRGPAGLRLRQREIDILNLTS